MTKADAIYYLMWLRCDAIDDADSHRCEALNMAINALENERPKGHWEYEDDSINFVNLWQCSNCYEVVDDKTDFCPNCGADMRQNLVGKHADVTIIDEACMKGADDE